MTQIINRRTISAAPLSTLADNTQIELDAIMAVLLHKAFLFEYRFRGKIFTLFPIDFFTGDGIQVVVIQGALAASTVDSFLSGAQITDKSQNVDVPARQALFEVATIKPATITSSTFGYFEVDLIFKPKAKGGIPFTEGSGWELDIINRGGAAMTTGSIIVGEIYERFAYQGGGGA